MMHDSQSSEVARATVNQLHELTNNRLKQSIRQQIYDNLYQLLDTGYSHYVDHRSNTTMVVIFSETGERAFVDVAKARLGNYEWPVWALTPAASRTRETVYEAIDAERKHQDEKYGVDKQQSIPGFLLIIRKELEEAEEGWLKNATGRHSVMAEICQIAATCVAAMEKYGTSGTATATDDIPLN